MVEEWCHDSVGECGVCASVPFGLRCWDMLLVLVLHVKDVCGSVCLCVLRWWVVGQWWASGWSVGVVVRGVAVVGVLLGRSVCDATGMGAVGWCTMGGGSSVGMTVSWTLGGQLGALWGSLGVRV